MKLRYRGTVYERAPCLKSIDGAIGGKYRGGEWRSRQLQTPLIFYSVHTLTYRGITYLSGNYRFASSNLKDLPRSHERAMS